MGGATTHLADLTIDELALRSGMTVRNIRAHQSRGLLPPPQVRGRTGYYGPEHVARIELIKELQAEGFNLESIRRLLESAGGSTEQVLRFTRAVAASFEEEEPEVAHVGDDSDRRALLERAVELGIVRPLGDGRYESRSPRLARAARELRNLGISRDRTVEMAAHIRRHTDGIAAGFVELFLDEVWRPFEAADRPSDGWPEVFDALERLRPLAAESVLAILQISMSEHVEAALGAEMERMSGDLAPPALEGAAEDGSAA